jgi:hypothetical protein
MTGRRIPNFRLERAGSAGRSVRRWPYLRLKGVVVSPKSTRAVSFRGHRSFHSRDAQSGLMTWDEMSGFLLRNWGNLASVLGLAVSVATLLVASKAREAAEAAKAAGRRQSFTEVLQDALRKNEQMGLFLSQRKWDIVWLRAQETASASSLALTRWPLELGAVSKDNLLRSQQLSSSIASVALRVTADMPTPREVARISQAKGRVAQLLNAELGESLRRSEGGTRSW